MKKLFFSLLLITSTNVFAMKTSEADDFDQLQKIARTLDQLARKHLRVVHANKRFRVEHFNGNDSRKYVKEKGYLEIEFTEKAIDFIKLQEKLFKVVICRPKIGIDVDTWTQPGIEHEETLQNKMLSSVVLNKYMKLRNLEQNIKSELCVQKIKEILEHGGTLPEGWDRQP